MDDSDTGIFKKCPMCSFEWKTMDDFIDDPALELHGYKAYFDNLDWGLFYFTHHVDGCHSTMAIEAHHFYSLYSGTKYYQRQTGTKNCPGHCLKKDCLEPCNAYCECAFNREVIQVINRRHQNGLKSHYGL